MLTPETDMLTQSPRMMWRFRPLRCVEDPAAELQKSQDGQRPPALREPKRIAFMFQQQGCRLLRGVRGTENVHAE